MILIDFLAMILLFAVHRLTRGKMEGDDDNLGNLVFIILMGFGTLFLFTDLIGKVKGLF